MAEEGGPFRVLIVEDHTIVRQGLVSLLRSDQRFVVAGECGLGGQAVEMAGQLLPDIVVLDLSLPDCSGIEVIGKLHQASPASRVVVLSMHGEASYVHPAMRAGISGYLVKGADIGTLVEALLCAMRGEVFLSPGIARLLVAPAAQGSEPQLSEREREVLSLVAQGKTSWEIGVILGISPKTVENHRQSIKSKLDIHDVAGLTRFAIRTGLIAPE